MLLIESPVIQNYIKDFLVNHPEQIAQITEVITKKIDITDDILNDVEKLIEQSPNIIISQLHTTKAGKFINTCIDIIDKYVHTLINNDMIPEFKGVNKSDTKSFTDLPKRQKGIISIYIYIINKILNILKENKHTTSQETKNSDVNDVLQLMLANLSASSASNTQQDEILQLMLNHINVSDDQYANDKQVRNVLKAMLTILTSAEINSVWKLQCYKKNSPSGDKNWQYDLYRPIDENFTKQLQAIGIDYFALQYTTQQPTALERAIKNPLNTRKIMNNASCKIGAFTKDNRPLFQFTMPSCHLERTESKDNFMLVSGTYPVLTKPEIHVNSEQFKQLILDNAPARSQEILKIPSANQIFENVIAFVYDELNKCKGANGVNCVDFLANTYATKQNNDIIQASNDTWVKILSVISSYIAQQQEQQNINIDQITQSVINDIQKNKLLASMIDTLKLACEKAE